MNNLLQVLNQYNSYLIYLYIPVLFILFIILIIFLFRLSSLNKKMNQLTGRISHTTSRATEMLTVLKERHQRLKENVRSFLQAFALFSFIRYVYKDYKRSKKPSLIKSLNRGMHTKVHL